MLKKNSSTSEASKRGSSLKKNSSFKTKDKHDPDLRNECERIFLSVFSTLDDDISTVEELILLLQHSGFNPSRKTINEYWDRNTDSYSFEQYLSIVKQERKTTKQDLMKAFRIIDKNNDGFITHAELSCILTKKGERMTKAEVKELFDNADFNGDGKLDYSEFCDMMEATAKKCKQLYRENNNTASQNIGSDEEEQGRQKSYRGKEKFSAREEKVPLSSTRDQKSQQNSSRDEKQQPTRKPSLLNKLASNKKQKEDDREESGGKFEKHTVEPKDLNRWHYQSSKGCVYKENPAVESNHYTLRLTQPSTVWWRVKTTSPKYGNFNGEILNSDIMLLLIDDNSKLVAYSNSFVDGKMCMQADLDIGTYTCLVYSSGNHLNEQQASGPASLVRGEGEGMRFTRACKDALSELFYRCDLDGNGYLSRAEFNEFQMRSSGEMCDDEAWEVVKETVEMTPSGEITLEGFLSLNLLEVQDPDGGPDELWVTLDTMGYSRKLSLVKACPFSVEVFTQRGTNALLRSQGVSPSSAEISVALASLLKHEAQATQFSGEKNLTVLVLKVHRSVLIGVENKSNQILDVRVDVSKSVNLVSQQDSKRAVSVHPRELQIMHHLTAVNPTQPTQLHYRESLS